MQEICAPFHSLDLDRQYKIKMHDVPSRVQVVVELTDRNHSPHSQFLSVSFVQMPPTHAQPIHSLPDDQVQPQDDEKATLFHLLEFTTQQAAASLCMLVRALIHNPQCVWIWPYQYVQLPSFFHCNTY